VTTFLLVHSPFAPNSTWLPVAACLRAAGHEAATPSLTGLAEEPPPYWPRLVERVRGATPGNGPVVLVGHSGAGPLLPAIGAAVGEVARFVFVDAALPVDGYTRATTMTAEERASAAFHEAAARGEVPNPWRSASTWSRVGIGGQRAAELAAATPPIPAAMNSEPVPVPPGWPEAPCAYLAFTPNPFYAPVVEEARARGWSVVELPGGHFHMLVEPEAVARALLRLGTGDG
jgi:hypothetical protein